MHESTHLQIRNCIVGLTIILERTNHAWTIGVDLVVVVVLAHNFITPFFCSFQSDCNRIYEFVEFVYTTPMVHWGSCVSVYKHASFRLNKTCGERREESGKTILNVLPFDRTFRLCLHRRASDCVRNRNSTCIANTGEIQEMNSRRRIK